jgi:hypothetical protein
MATPRNLNEAKAMIHAEKAKVASSLSAIAGSRWLMAILAAFALAFGLHAIYAPGRLPTIGGLSLTQAGLPPNLDFGKAGQLGQEAHDAAVRQDVSGHVTSLIDQHAAFIPYVNYAGFAIALALLLGNMWIMTRRRRFTRG